MSAYDGNVCGIDLCEFDNGFDRISSLDIDRRLSACLRKFAVDEKNI